MYNTRHQIRYIKQDLRLSLEYTKCIPIYIARSIQVATSTKSRILPPVIDIIKLNPDRRRNHKWHNEPEEYLEFSRKRTQTDSQPLRYTYIMHKREMKKVSRKRIHRMYKTNLKVGIDQ